MIQYMYIDSRCFLQTFQVTGRRPQVPKHRLSGWSVPHHLHFAHDKVKGSRNPQTIGTVLA